MADSQSLRKPLLSQFPNSTHPRKILRWRLYDGILACVAVVGLVTALVDYEQRYSELRTHGNCREEEIGEGYRWATLITSVIGAFFLVLRHSAKLQDLREREHRKLVLGRSPEKIERRFLSFGLGLELLVLLVFPYPYLRSCVRLPQHYRTVMGGAEYADTEVAYTGGEIAYFFMYIRLFFLFRSLFQLVPFQDTFAIEVCEPHHVKANIRFSIKCLFKMYPMSMIVTILIATIPLIAYLLRLAERPFNDLATMDLNTYATTLWCTAVTIATIGYGDYYPYTNLGRIICALTGAWGAVMFSVIVFVIQDGMDLTKRQHTCFLKIRGMRSSAELILIALRCYSARYQPQLKASLRFQLAKAAKIHRLERIQLNRFSFRREEEIVELSSKVELVQAQVQALDRKLDLLLAAKAASRR